MGLPEVTAGTGKACVLEIILGWSRGVTGLRPGGMGLEGAPSRGSTGNLVETVKGFVALIDSTLDWTGLEDVSDLAMGLNVSVGLVDEGLALGRSAAGLMGGSGLDVVVSRSTRDSTVLVVRAPVIGFANEGADLTVEVAGLDVVGAGASACEDVAVREMLDGVASEVATG